MRAARLDARRLRPNMLLGGVDDLTERGGEGARLRIGAEATVELHSLRDGRIVTTFDPDTTAQDVDVLRNIHARFDGKVALNATVVNGGEVAVGDAVELLP